MIFAGGTGQRMNTRTRPKQFLELHGKPIIIYTLEAFEDHGEIDGIIVVMLESWIPYTQELISKYNLKKVKKVVPGGSSGQDSIYNGLCAAAQFYGDDDIVLIHDGVRPLIDEETITANIRGVEKLGTAITVTAAIETITMKDETGAVGTIIAQAAGEFRGVRLLSGRGPGRSPRGPPVQKALKPDKVDPLPGWNPLHGHADGLTMGGSEYMKRQIVSSPVHACPPFRRSQSSQNRG